MIISLTTPHCITYFLMSQTTLYHILSDILLYHIFSITLRYTIPDTVFVLIFPEHTAHHTTHRYFDMNSFLLTPNKASRVYLLLVPQLDGLHICQYTSDTSYIYHIRYNMKKHVFLSQICDCL